MKDGHDPVKHGFRKMDFGGEEQVNHRIEGAYNKQAKGGSSEKTKVKKIAEHHPHSPMFSGKSKKK